MTKSNALAGQLFVVATPIGNLEDITLRAIRVLQTVDRIAAEDTRHAQMLLNHLRIEKPMLALHNFNERERAETLLAALGAELATGVREFTQHAVVVSYTINIS